MVFYTTEDGKGFKCDLSEAELMLAEKNPESFKNYLDYQTKLREDFLSDIREQKIHEIELIKHQNELKYADLKDQREKNLEDAKDQRAKNLENAKDQRNHDYRCRELDARESKEYRDFDEKRRKDAWAFILGVGTAAIDNFWSNYQEAKQFVNDLNQLPDSSLDETKED